MENTESTLETERGKLQITMFDVGKADAFVLQTENSTIVIDCGTEKKGKSVRNYLKNEGIDTIDCMIITHFDQDHVGGAAKIIKKYDVKEIYTPNYQENNNEYEEYCNEMEEKGIVPNEITEPVSLEFDNVKLDIYPPKEERYGSNDFNDLSLITTVKCNEFSALFTGDILEKRIEEWLDMDMGTFDILKVPYHGRNIANLGAFLDSVQPEYALISTTEEEFCTRTRMLLEDRDIKYYSTFADGIVTVNIDENITISGSQTESS